MRSDAGAGMSTSYERTESSLEDPSHNAQCVERESCGTTHADPDRMVTKPDAQQTENMQGSFKADSSHVYEVFGYPPRNLTRSGARVIGGSGHAATNEGSSPSVGASL